MNIFVVVIGAATLASAAVSTCWGDPIRIAFPADSVDFTPAYVAQKIGLFKSNLRRPDPACFAAEPPYRRR
jgi:hypothetical protein